MACFCCGNTTAPLPGKRKASKKQKENDRQHLDMEKTKCELNAAFIPLSLCCFLGFITT